MHRHMARKIILFGGGPQPWQFNPSGTLTFTPGMAKRATSVFAASPIVQGKRDGTGTTDLITHPTGNQIAGYFYQDIDAYQGSICLRITPEWNGNDGIEHTIYKAGATSKANITKSIGNQLVFSVQSLSLTVDISAWTAGTTYNICGRWDTKNTLDGTNYACISINDTHTFGVTTIPTQTSDPQPYYIGSYNSGSPANAIIEGLTIYRRVLYDGTYGVNVGNGDEVNLISAGVDPTTVTGSWDVVFCLPTNATAGALVTGTGEAWSHPHSSNLLTRGFLSDRYYGGGQWGVKFTGTGKIDCGNNAGLNNLADNEFTLEGWFLSNVDMNIRIYKGLGWFLQYDISSGRWRGSVGCATTSAVSTTPTNSLTGDGKWHHLVIYFNDAGDRKVYMAQDGIWLPSSQIAGVGAILDDSADKLLIAENQICSTGWIRISNNDRYNHGTNFLVPRTPPSLPDANTIAQWNMSEGTGTTVDNAEGTATRDGTITNGTWEQQWYDEGTPVRLRSVVGGASYAVNVGSDAAIDDLADGAFTVDGWFRLVGTGAQRLAYKGTWDTTGWRLGIVAGGYLGAGVKCATTHANSRSDAIINDGLWHYIKMTFDDAGDRKIDLFVDNVEVTYNDQTAGVGAILSDAGDNGYLSNSVSPILATSAHGWIRWSNSVRGAGMIPRSNPPAVDANTVGQWNCTEGAGAVLDNAEGTATRDGAMTGTYSWQNSPAMESDSPGSRNYAWGYVFGNDGADEGFKQTWSGLTVGKDYVIRGLAYSEDGVGQPEMIVYDETNGAILKTMTGTLTSTEKVPDILMCSFELPTAARGAAANCTSISVKIINTSATGVVGFQQVELLANLLDNPSFDTGAVADPWIPDGWINDGLDAGDSEIETVLARSGGACIQINAGAGNGNEDVRNTPIVASGKFLGWGGFGYGNRTYSHYSGAQARASYQYASGTIINLISNSASWVHKACVGRKGGSDLFFVEYGNGADASYVDDCYIVLLDDVSLTVTPASAANSVESSGVRVDGLDVVSQTITAGKILASSGWLKFRYIPRHSAADVAKFGNATPAIAQIWGGANDYITIDWAAANTMRLTYNANGAGAQTANWDATGAIVAGTTYTLEIKYTATQMQLLVNGIAKITITAAVAFGTVPTTFYAGALQAGTGQNDCVLLN